ncbi:hypothetical protein [Chitinophaga pinensis]|uniref:Uncharacterized protein n=1 Tax=Chitinophaga pinensis (strain ATCC 43595 / DSM 2588 / LMG 13176 / NBRC 15968 / NCIMB 11800 / UQM 2034) TaxID=485918 RepID=A0A979GVK6_CHIPD|nr:hypothetical protein [Chitinophaga pinensis]ACU61414.1 hypothetical protein Cpin_3952 [Chitinophaga pinensis DSM 2588]
MKYLRTGMGLFFLLFASQTYAQTPAQAPSVQLSATFPEPGEGFDKILLLPNGNTCYLHFDKKQGIVASLYDAQRAPLATEAVKGQLWDASGLNDTEIDGLFVINDQVVIFLQQLVKYKPNLYRLVLDGSNGKLVKEDKLGELPTVLHRDVAVQENFASHDFHVSVDAATGYYAVAAFAGGELQRKESPAERVQISHYGPDHQLIRQRYFTVAENDYPYLAYLDMLVSGSDKIYLATAALNNTRKSSKDTSALVALSVWGKGDNSFSHTLLPYTTNFTDLHASLQYVSGTNTLQALITTTNNQTAKAPVPAAYINYLDGGTLALNSYTALHSDKITAFAQEKMKYTSPYNGQPQALIAHADGSSTVLMESMSVFASAGSNSWNKMHTNLNDIGVTELDARGREQSGYGLVKMQVANGTYEPLYFQRRKKGQWIFRNRIQVLNTTPYLSYDYLPTAKATYIIFNDYLAYLDQGGTFTDKKPMRYLAEANTVCYRCTPTGQERLFLFGTPETFKGYYCMLGASDFDQKKGTYATLMITRKGENKSACVAWVKF